MDQIVLSFTIGYRRACGLIKLRSEHVLLPESGKGSERLENEGQGYCADTGEVRLSSTDHIAEAGRDGRWASDGCIDSIASWGWRCAAKSVGNWPVNSEAWWKKRNGPISDGPWTSSRSDGEWALLSES